MNCVINQLTTNVPHHIEASHLTCSANQLTGFYMMGTLFVNGLTHCNLTWVKKDVASYSSPNFGVLRYICLLLMTCDVSFYLP